MGRASAILPLMRAGVVIMPECIQAVMVGVMAVRIVWAWWPGVPGVLAANEGRGGRSGWGAGHGSEILGGISQEKAQNPPPRPGAAQRVASGNDFPSGAC
jgi:hypothetical protein